MLYSQMQDQKESMSRAIEQERRRNQAMIEDQRKRTDEERQQNTARMNEIQQWYMSQQQHQLQHGRDTTQTPQLQTHLPEQVSLQPQEQGSVDEALSMS